VVNRALARRFFPGRSAIGERLRAGFDDQSPWLTVVGVVADARNGGMDQPARPELFFDSDQAAAIGFSPSCAHQIVRAQGDPLALAPALRAAMREIDPQTPLFRLRTMDDVVQASMSRPRFLALLLSILSAMALLLAAVGIYGVIAYQVAQRRREIGVRVALGADRGSIARLVLADGLRLVVAGVALGIAGALALTRVLEGLLYEVSPLDLPSFLAATIVLLAVAATACWLPAIHATRVDPMVALRAE
jgi:putative ABC transport system permease protein